jgi:hypothetical protein
VLAGHVALTQSRVVLTRTEGLLVLIHILLSVPPAPRHLKAYCDCIRRFRMSPCSSSDVVVIRLVTVVDGISGGNGGVGWKTVAGVDACAPL